AGNFLAWLNEYWSTLSVVLLALVSLVTLRSMTKSTRGAYSAPRERTSFDGRPALAPLADEPPADLGVEAAWAPSRRRAADGPSLRDELADMVRDDPEAAAGILRTWIGNAS